MPHLVTLGIFCLKAIAAIALWLTFYPCVIFDPSNVLLSGQGFLLPNLVAIRDFQAI